MANATEKIVKVTKVMKYNAIINALADNSVVEIEGQSIDLAEFARNEIALIQKKSASKVSKKVDNSAEMEIVRNVLANGVELSASEIALNGGLKSTPKATAVLKAMGDEIVRTQKGKKVTFRLA